jgi:hypothetical protein
MKKSRRYDRESRRGEREERGWGERRGPRRKEGGEGGNRRDAQR